MIGDYFMQLDSQEILFYVCVPIYKTEKYLTKCIESVLIQNYKNFILILVDDGSPDGCGEICDFYAKKFENVKVIHQNNAGLLAARRAAVEYALHNGVETTSNKFILFLDSDDEFKEGAFQVIADNLIKTKADMIIFGYDLTYNNSIINSFDVKHAVQGIIADKRELYKIVFTDSQYNSLCRKAISINIIKKMNYDLCCNVSRAEDLLQSISFYKNANTILFLPVALYNYNVNPNSITHSIDYKSYQVNSSVRSMVLEFIIKENVFDENDMINYLRFCQNLLLDEICLISNFKTSIKNKKLLFSKILRDEYYSKLIFEKDCSHIIFHFLAKRNYCLTILFSKINCNLKRIKRKARRLFNK